MTDSEIIRKLEARDETALQDITEQYGKLGKQIAMRILGSTEDAEECTNDALLRIWNTIPPAKPLYLKAYYSAAVRNIALNRRAYDKAQKRNTAVVSVVLDELSEVLPDTQDVEAETDATLLNEAVRGFLRKQNKLQQTVFMQRYYYMMTCAEIAEGLGVSENRVNVILHRLRKKLQAYLRKGAFL